MALYLKLFLATGIPFGIIMGMIHDPLLGLRSGAAFGVLMSLVLGTIQYMTTDSLKGDNLDARRVRQDRTLFFESSKDDAFEHCRSALGNLKKCEIFKVNKETGIIQAKTGTTWKSFGESVSITIQEESTNMVSINIKSEPGVKTTMIDYGKNFQNVEVILSYLEDYMVNSSKCN